MPTQEQIEASGLPYDLVMAMYYDKNPVQTGGGYFGYTQHGGNNNPGNNGSFDYNGVRQTIYNLVQQGNMQAAEQVFDRYFDSMSEKEKTYLAGYLYGEKKP